MVKQYILELKCEDDAEPDWSRIGEFSHETTVYFVPDLLPGRKYFFRMKCVFSNGSETPWSDEKEQETEGDYDPEQIQVAVKTNLEYRAIALKKREEQES